MRRSRTSGARTTWTFVLLNTLFMVAGAAVAALALAPVFESSRYVIVVAVAAAAGACVTILADRLGRGPGFATLLIVIAYVAGGLGLAIPGALSDLDSVAASLLELVRGPVLGWKDIVTLPLPLGAYRGTLVPVYALFLVGTLLATWAAVRARRWWPLGAVVVGVMVVLAIALGPATRAPTPPWAPAGLYVTREFAIGLAAFLLMLGWFGWRSAYQRRRAISRAHGADRARLTRAPHLRNLAGAAAVAVMVMLGTVTAVLVAGPIAADTPREVARTVVDPRLTLDSAVTPLATYRSWFTDDAYDAVLFSVTVTEGAPQRVRVAALPSFDGESFSASAREGEAPVRFQRVPSTIPAGEDTVPAGVDIAIGAGGGIWVPLVGELGSISFQGARRSQLVDGFFYLPEEATGITAVEGGVVSGDAYRVRGNVPQEPLTLADLGPSPGSATIEASLIPPALSDWVARQEVSRDGEGLQELITRLRERGYLSHALEQPVDGDLPRWQEDLGEYAFASSAAGHSYDRIERLFTQLLEREDSAGDAGSASLVAAVGDDEQFAAAAALMAAELGFPSRVVLGARLADTDPAGYATAVCEAGECRGSNMTAWVEVQGADGAWAAADVTPQHESPLAPDTTALQDPEFASALDPERAEAIVPPSTQRGTTTEDEAADEEEPGGLTWLGPALRIGGISLLALLVIVGPFLAILAWKAARRRRRRRGEPASAIHSGWEEYLDTAVESGLDPLPLATRSETAAAYATANGAALATMSDRATFSGAAARDADAQEFWELVEADRAAWLAQRGWWARLRMRTSLRSVWHSVATPTAPPQAKQSRPGAHWRSEHTSGTGSRRSRRGTRGRRGRTKGGRS
ncbi:transglutaminase domain-containing protein [Demequina activiva]|uniref:Cysteine protease n=1 Tax=Demequina activiva TaxID=1582364 RepID=A0A919UJT3_9MICO|nr:transglutaminase domain-containing protein [Demequina activiva]GIG54160.1 cysteine protease [Demequina activiva]